MKNIRMLAILESLFQRGYTHGRTSGMSSDGETYAVSDALKSLKKHYDCKIKKGHKSVIETGRKKSCSAKKKSNG